MAPAPDAARDHDGTPIELDTIEPASTDTHAPPPLSTTNSAPPSPQPTHLSNTNTVTHEPKPPPASPSPHPTPATNPTKTNLITRLKNHYNQYITPTIPLGALIPPHPPHPFTPNTPVPSTPDTPLPGIQTIQRVQRVQNDIRDHLALERTFFSRFRTANALALFGVLVVQLFRLNTFPDPSPTSTSSPNPHATSLNYAVSSTDSTDSTSGSHIIVGSRESVPGKVIAGIAITGAVVVVLDAGWGFVKQQRSVREGRFVVGGWVGGVWVEAVVVGCVVLGGLVVVCVGG